MLLFWILLTVVVCFFLYLYMIMPNTSRRSKILPYLKRDYAHRGLHDSSRLIPENSMPAFREAVKQNLAIELDIHLTRDGKVVVFHDESLKRICNAEGTVEGSTFVKTVNNQLSAIMNYAVSHYRLPVNPCKAAGSMGKSKADEMNIWTQAEYEKFSNAINKSSMKLAFDILFYTGMRSGELLALTPADILSSKRIDINKNYAKIKGEELFLEPKTPKAKRCISIPDFLYNDIQEYISKLYGIGNGDRIFYFQKTALEKEMKRVSERVGLKPIRVHDLRHSHASMLIELGFTPLEIAERLGHESIKTTLDTYSHLYPDKDQKLADRLNQFRKN